MKRRPPRSTLDRSSAASDVYKRQAHAYSTLDAAGFRDALEASTGYDLHPFFTDQVFAPGFSVFVVQGMAVHPGGGLWDVNLIIQQKLRGATVFHQEVPLDITLIGASGERKEYRQLVGGEFSAVPLQCAFEPVMAVLNGHNRLNQARMDIDQQLVPGEAFTTNLPRVDFRLYADSLADTTLVRIEHIWAAPDQGPLGTAIDELSPAHYWTVDGLWPEGTALHARLTYSALSPASVDHDFLGTDETGLLVAYRADASMPVSYTHLRAHETVLDLVCRLLLEKKKQRQDIVDGHSTICKTTDRFDLTTSMHT